MKLTAIAILLIVISANHVFAQKDTIFLSAYSLPIKNKADAKYYRFVGKPDFGQIKVEDFYFSGQKKTVFYVSAKDTATYDGKITTYDEKGYKIETGRYVSNTRTGIWKRYYEGSDLLWVQSEFLPYGGDTTEILRSFYKNGKLKRIEYSGKEIDTGICYTQDGQLRPFTPFSTMPEPDYDWQTYVAQHIKYPKSAIADGMYGRVNVQLMVSKEGKVSDVVATNDAETPLAKEAVRVITEMPDWKPGIEDDTLVDVRFILPVTFRLK